MSSPFLLVFSTTTLKMLHKTSACAFRSEPGWSLALMLKGSFHLSGSSRFFGNLPRPLQKVFCEELRALPDMQ